MTDKGDEECEEIDLCPPTEEQRSTPSLEEEPYEGEPRSAHEQVATEAKKCAEAEARAEAKAVEEVRLAAEAKAAEAEAVEVMVAAEQQQKAADGGARRAGELTPFRTAASYYPLKRFKRDPWTRLGLGVSPVCSVPQSGMVPSSPARSPPLCISWAKSRPRLQTGTPEDDSPISPNPGATFPPI